MKQMHYNEGMQEKLQFLRSLKIFSHLSDEELNQIADLCKAWKFDKDAVIAWQKEVADKLYIVREGILNAYHVDAAGEETLRKSYIRGEYFDELWLFGEDVHDATIRAEMAGSLYMIDQIAFETFVEQNPHAELDMVEQAWVELDQMAVSPTINDTYRNMRLLPGELVEYESKRTMLLLLAALFEPFLWILLGLFLSIFFSLIYRTIFGESILREYPTLVLVFGGLTLVPGVLYGLWHYIDWYNDYLIVTDRHIVHREFVLRRFANEIQKLPIDQVQSVSTLRGSFFESWLGIGTVRVTTAAQSDPLTFEHITDPGEAEAAYNKVRNRYSSTDVGRERLAVREAIQAHFGAPSQINWQPEIHDDIELPDLNFRRHSSVLFNSLLFPLFGFTVSSFFFVLAVNLLTERLTYTLLPVNEMPILQTILWFFGVAGLIGLIYFANACIKATNKWRDGRFVGKATGLIDGGANTILHIKASQTALGRLLGYGNVTIEMKDGRVKPSVFAGVAHPNRVQKNMSARWSAVRRRQGLPGILNPDGEPLAQRMQLPELVYKRHWLVFARTAIIPILAFIAILVGIVFLLSLHLANDLFPLNVLIIIGIVCFFALLVSFGFAYYYYEDWRNDEFLVTASQVIDVDRKPFRLDEDRKVAGIDNVQNVNISQNYLGTFFGYGDVIIDTAGANADIVFEDVNNPIRVQADIFERREEFRRIARQRDAVNRRQEILLALDEYQQLREQDKLPRLTPEIRPQFVPENETDS